MSDFTVHTAASAPEASKATLDQVAKNYGFLPNLFGVLAESPAAVEAYASLSGIYGKTSLSATEQQIVLLTASRINGCTYCVAAHSTVAQMAKVDADIVEALRAGTALSDAKLEAFRQLVVAVVEQRGWVDAAILQAFFNAGYSRAQYLDVLVGVTLKTLSNFTNHVADTPLDDAFAPNAWQADAPVAVAVG